MKIAIPTREGHVDNHFGHCEMYTLFTIDDQQQIREKEHLPSPQGCGCKSNIASVLKERGVSLMLAGNMGNGALNVLQHQGIEVIRGCSGEVNSVIEAYLKGKVSDSGKGCLQHEHHHAGHGSGHQAGHKCNH